MNTKVAIRLATKYDLEGIRLLQEQCFEKGEQYSPEVLSHLYETSPIHCVAVTNESEIVGFLITMGACDYKECLGLTIASFAIAEKYRKHGLGKSMLVTFLDIIESLTITHPVTGEFQTADVTLQVRKSNAVAIHLYEQLGFIQDPTEIKDYYSDPIENAYIMFKMGHPVNKEQVMALRKEAEPESPKKIAKLVPKDGTPSGWQQWKEPVMWGLAGLGVLATGLAIGARLIRGNKAGTTQ
jgi:ribosomal protein S18 acetylase RimI-like enzyme